MAAERRPDDNAPEYARMYPITPAHGGRVQGAVAYIKANLSRPEV